MVEYLTVPADCVLFTQGSIASRFRTGEDVDAECWHTRNDIDVFRDRAGRLWAFNNRTLYNQTRVHGRQHVNVRVITDRRQIARRMRRKNGNGVDVRVRGQPRNWYY
jgi:hypothetical protein